MRYKADQEWLLTSPELLALNEYLISHSLLKECSPSDKFDIKPTHRLGVYFEQLWSHLVKQSATLELAFHNLQVIIENHTYGEFDSIINNSGETIHCELAVKFYLQVGNGGSLSDWVGPNLKDRFDDKYQRLFNHQLALSDKKLIKQWLAVKDIQIDSKKLLCKGRLFYPYKEYIKESFLFPQEVSSKHLKGFWIHYKALDELLNQMDYQWFQLPRFYWLAEVEKIDDQLLAVEKEFSGFSLQKIVALDKGKEVMRGFVVNDDWLNKAQQRVLD